MNTILANPAFVRPRYVAWLVAGLFAIALLGLVLWLRGMPFMPAPGALIVQGVFFGSVVAVLDWAAWRQLLEKRQQAGPLTQYIKALIKAALPRNVLGRLVRESDTFRTTYTLEGKFYAWSEAVAAAETGYEDPDLIQRVADRNLAEAAHIQQGKNSLSGREGQILAAITYAKARLGNESIQLVDYGGEMGGLHRSLMRFMPEGALKSWVIETPTMAAKASEHFASADLAFASQLHKVPSSESEVVVISGTFQVLPDPHGTFSSITVRQPRFIIVSVHPVHSGGADWLTVRRVNGHNYVEAYPLWVFSRTKWNEKVNDRGYKPVMTWQTEDKTDTLPDGQTVSYIGMLLELQPTDPLPTR